MPADIFGKSCFAGVYVPCLRVDFVQSVRGRIGSVIKYGQTYWIICTVHYLCASLPRTMSVN